MNRADARRWRKAATTGDLGDLVIGWLNGELTETPGHGGGPCEEETLPLAAVLATINRAGFVTDNMQQAHPAGDAAYLMGWASDGVLSLVRSVTGGTPLTVTACRGRAHGERHGWRVGFSCPWRAEVGNWSYACPRAARVLEQSWYVTVTDPEPRRGDLLWDVLPLIASCQPGAR